MPEGCGRIPDMVSKLMSYINRDIWRVPGRKVRKSAQGYLFRTLRIFVLSIREFTTDQCSLWASALTFYSLLSIVPVLAMAFGVAKGFGLDKLLREKLMESAQGQEEVMGYIVNFSENFLQNTKGGLIAGIGLVLLFWTVIKVLTNIENAFNHIWGIKKGRTLGKKFTDYLAFMLIAPVVFVAGSSASVFIVSQIELITNKISLIGFAAPLILAAVKVLPFLVFSGLLTYLYIFLPNGRIRFRSALLGGVVSGAVYQTVQWVYIHFQIGASNAGAVYGTFAALPLFLVWLQTSWLIVLYGAELAFAHQNEDNFEFEPECRKVSYEFKKLVALRIMQVYVTRFAEGQPPLSAHDLADRLDLPIRLTQQLLDHLCESGLLNAVPGAEDERERLYQPARDVSDMTVQSVLRDMARSGTADIPLEETPQMEKLRLTLEAFDRALLSHPSNTPLRDIGGVQPVFPAEKKPAFK